MQHFVVRSSDEAVKKAAGRVRPMLRSSRPFACCTPPACSPAWIHHLGAAPTARPASSLSLASGPQRYGVEQLGPAGAGLLPDPQLLQWLQTLSKSAQVPAGTAFLNAPRAPCAISPEAAHSPRPPTRSWAPPSPRGRARLRYAMHRSSAKERPSLPRPRGEGVGQKRAAAGGGAASICCWRG